MAQRDSVSILTGEAARKAKARLAWLCREMATREQSGRFIWCPDETIGREAADLAIRLGFERPPLQIWIHKQGQIDDIHPSSRTGWEMSSSIFDFLPDAFPEAETVRGISINSLKGGGYCSEILQTTRTADGQYHVTAAVQKWKLDEMSQQFIKTMESWIRWLEAPPPVPCVATESAMTEPKKRRKRDDVFLLKEALRHWHRFGEDDENQTPATQNDLLEKMGLGKGLAKWDRTRLSKVMKAAFGSPGMKNYRSLVATDATRGFLKTDELSEVSPQAEAAFHRPTHTDE